MSAATGCDCNCPTPEIENIPGAPGEDGAAGADGDNGINAYTVTTANVTLPGVAGPIVAPINVGVSSWMAVGQTIFLSDGTNLAHVRVDTIPSATTITATWLDYDGDSAGASVIASGAAVVASGIQPTGPFAVANGGTGGITATAARANLGVGGASLTVYASGTAYQFTNTDALLNFGTTDPSLTLTSAGVWLILATARVDYNAATFAAVRTLNLKLRRTNNTAADIANSVRQGLTDIITTLSYTFGVFALPPIIYTTTNVDDVIELWGSISVVPSAGSLDGVAAEIVAIKLYDQTV